MQDKAYPDKTRSAVTDPVCGMQVAADSDHRHTHEGTEYLFCSAACHDRFVAAPGKYLPAEPKGISSGYWRNRLLPGRHL